MTFEQLLNLLRSKYPAKSEEELLDHLFKLAENDNDPKSHILTSIFASPELAKRRSLAFVKLAEKWCDTLWPAIRVQLVESLIDLEAAKFILASPKLSEKLGQEVYDRIVKMWRGKLLSDKKFHQEVRKKNKWVTPYFLKVFCSINNFHPISRLYENLRANDWPVEIKGNKGYLTIDKHEYQIINETMTNFVIGPVKAVLIGANLSREIVAFDSSAELLQQKYIALGRHLLATKALDLEAILKETAAFIRKECLPPYRDSDKMDEKVKEFRKTWSKQKFKDNPVIPLEKFIEKNIGVCRHHALLAAYFLDRLQKERILPTGEIHYHRGYLQGDLEKSHNVVIFHPYEKDPASSKLYLFDSYNDVYGSLGNIRKEKFSAHYGAAFFNICEKMYLGGHCHDVTFWSNKKVSFVEKVELIEDKTPVSAL